MAQLNLDVVGQIVQEVAAFDSAKEKQDAFRALGALSRDFAYATRSLLFKYVRWPHPDKQDDEGLQFFPETLWGYFQNFYLDWPDYWPDASPPAWGVMYQFGEYVPKHLDKLEQALPKMTNIYTLQITCPFYPPTSLLLTIVGCTNIKDLKIVDTPYNKGIPLNALPATFNLERLTFVPVGETNRVGEGPFEKKYYDITYYTRSYRKKYWTDSHGGYFARLLPGWALLNIFCLARPDTLTYIQISGRYCTLHDFQGTWWPNLETLVLSGPEPSTGCTTLKDVVGRMPKLWDLRVLISQLVVHATTQFQRMPFVVVQTWMNTDDVKDNVNVSNPSVFSRVRNLAVSSVCSLEGAFRYMTSLERLALIAVINHPRIPIARSREDVDDLMNDLEETGSGRRIKVLRIMMEDGLDAGLLKRLGRVCPLLENLEVEVCGYRDREAGFEWTDYGDSLEKYEHLERLRIGIPFEGYDENNPDLDPEAFLRGDRRDFGNYLATRVHTLRQIGFEYRMRTGSHRYEDRWLDFDIERLVDGSIRLWEMGQTWYPFPEVWEPVSLQE